MSRKTIFEVLNQKMDIYEEIMRLEMLCKQDFIVGADGFIDYSYTMEEFVDRYCFLEWKNRNRCLNCKDMRKKLNISEFDMKNRLREETILIYLEYLANMIWLCEVRVPQEDNVYWHNQNYQLLKVNLCEVINWINYEIRVFEDEEKVILVEKNAATTAVVEIVESGLACDVIQYNHYLMKGDTEGKRRILKVLADKIEPVRTEFKRLKIHKELESDVGFLLNKMNIRHNNIEGENAIAYVKDMSREELEDWYDETYQLILLCMLEFDNIERNKKISELKKCIL